MSDRIIIEKRPPKSPAAAGVLSGFLAGAGQLYNGQASKALLFFIVWAGLISIIPPTSKPVIFLRLSNTAVSIEIIGHKSRVKDVVVAGAAGPGSKQAWRGELREPSVVCSTGFSRAA